MDIGAHAFHARQLRDLSPLVKGEGTETNPWTGFTAAVAGLKLRRPARYEERRRTGGGETARHAGVDAVHRRRHHRHDEHTDRDAEDGEAGAHLVRPNRVECNDDALDELV